MDESIEEVGSWKVATDNMCAEFFVQIRTSYYCSWQNDLEFIPEDA